MRDAYLNYPLFKSYCDNSAINSHLQHIKTVSETSDKRLYAKTRQSILINVGELKADTIYCRKNVADYFDGLIKNECCLRAAYFCASCDKKKIRKFGALKIKQFDINLDRYLNDRSTKLCLECPEQECSTVEYTFSQIIVFDVQNNQVEKKLNDINKEL